MSAATDNLATAQRRAMRIRPAVGGFPVLAEVLRQAGVTRNVWQLPSAQAIYLTTLGPVIDQGQPLVSGLADVPAFEQDALIRALRIDQQGQSSFPEFLQHSWDAGVISFDIDFMARHVTYCGSNGESYVEQYPAVKI